MEENKILDEDDGFKLDERQKKIFELINSRPEHKPSVVEEEIDKFNELTAKRSISFDGTDYKVRLYLLTTYPEDVKTTNVRLELTESNRQKEKVITHGILLDASNLHDAAEELRAVAKHKDYPSFDETTSLLVTTLVNQKLDETLKFYQGAKFADLRDQVRLGNYEAAGVLVARGADINAQVGLTGNTLLHEMSNAENIEAVSWLLDKGANSSIRNSEGQSFWDREVYAAIREGGRALNEDDADRLNQSLDKLRAIVSMDSPGDVNAKRSYTHSPMHEAVLSVNDYAIPVLASNGANVNSMNKDGDTPLHIASKDGWSDGIRILLETGADITIRNTAGKTPTDELEEKYRITGDEDFLRLKEMVEAFEERKLIDDSLRIDRLNDRLIEISPWLRDVDERAWIEVRGLIENGANPNFREKGNGFTALHYASTTESTEKAQWLLDHGADINLQTENFGATPLIRATMSGQKDMVEFLLSRGADSSIKLTADIMSVKAGMTARDIAEKQEKTDIVDLIDAYDEKKRLESSMSKKVEPEVKRKSPKL